MPHLSDPKRLFFWEGPGSFIFFCIVALVTCLDEAGRLLDQASESPKTGA